MSNEILEDRGGEVLCDGKMPGRFCVSLVAAVVGNSFCVATSMSCSALLNFGFVRGVLRNFALPNAQYLVINFFGVFRVTITAKPMKRKDRTAEKAAAVA